MRRLGKKAFNKSIAAATATILCCSCLLAACTVDYGKLNEGLYTIGKGLNETYGGVTTGNTASSAPSKKEA